MSYGYQVWISDATQVTSAVANLININQSAPAYPTSPTAIIQNPLGPTVVTNGIGSACTYNLHARNGAMLAIGGSPLGTTTASSAIFTASSNSFSTSAGVTSYNLSVSSPAFFPTTGAGLTLLYSGNLVYFGGLTSTGQYSNAVYSSSSTTGFYLPQAVLTVRLLGLLAPTSSPVLSHSPTIY